MFDYTKYQNEQLKAGGFDPATLTEEQKGVILMPSEAPENYMCDGEITRAQALTRWKRMLTNAGLSPADKRKAIAMNGR